MSSSHELGRKSESFAAHFLQKNGYLIRAKNFRYLKAEIDIIAEKNETLVFVEVKARSSDAFGLPESFVSHKKKQLFISAADHYVHQNKLDFEVRFDIIAILWTSNGPAVEHFKDAFYFF